MKRILHDLIEKIVCNKYRGWDPYDGLNSWWASLPVLCQSKWFRIAVTQFFRRSPVNLRPFLGVKKKVNPKALGLLLLSDAQVQGQLFTDKERQEICRIIETKKVEKYDGMGWGYPFDWQSRTFYQPENTPTVVASSFVGFGLVAQRKQKLLPSSFNSQELFNGIAEFIRSLNRYEDSRGICLSYSPLDNSQVYNASLLGAAYLAEYNLLMGTKKDKALIRKIVKFVLSVQRSSGAWAYGEDDDQGWVDHYHTGFILDSLRKVNHFLNDREIEESIDIGDEYYLENFFENKRIPKMYPRKIYPVDIHSCAQAHVTLSKIIGSESKSTKANRAKVLLRNVRDWTIDNMWDDSKNFFYHRKYRFFTNRINYLRWNQAWMCYGLSSALKALEGDKDEVS